MSSLRRPADGIGQGESVGYRLQNGSQSLLAFDLCTCSFEGHSGTVAIEAYGTTTGSGVANGHFHIISGELAVQD
jgi:hypothetical protein